MVKLKPLFKWTGGKNKMRQKYENLFIPERRCTRFIDAFYGAGAVTHWINDENAADEFVINDFNKELIDLYCQLRDNPDDFIGETLKLQESYLNTPFVERKPFYNKLKLAHINDYETMGPLITAVNLHFMMRINFNGWWKMYNYSNGRYATPPGTLNEKRPFINIQNLLVTSKFFSEKCIITCGDFEGVRKFVNDDTFVYFDPPYRDSTTNYTDEGFDERDQIRLCEFFDECSTLGANVSLSNKEIGDGFFENHLGAYNLHVMNVKYSAGRGDTINEVEEILVSNYTPRTPTTLEDFF